MNTVTDILGATIIGGIVFLIMLNLNIYSSESKFSSDSNLRLQQNAETLAQIIDSDLRKVGYNYSGSAITDAEPSKFSFYADIDSNGTADAVTRALSVSLQVMGTTNPHDKILYVIVNGDTSKGPSLGLTNLRFTYMNGLGDTTSVPSQIKFIKAEIWLQTPEKVDTNYVPTYWEVTVNPRNL